MTFIMQIVTWIISDIRHIIIVVLSILLIATVVYCGYMRWDVAHKDSQLSELKIENNQLRLNNTNLAAQNEQLRQANEALQKYVNGILTIKRDMEAIRAKVQNTRSKEDEIENNNALANMWNNR